VSIDIALRPEGWAPKAGSRVVILPEAKAAADAPPPPPGVWWVVDRAPESGCWWLMPDDGEARVWTVVQRAGRAEMPAGWPAQQVSSRRLFPAALVQRALPGMPC